MKSVSKAAYGLLQWVTAMVKYFDVAQGVERTRKLVIELQEKKKNEQADDILGWTTLELEEIGKKAAAPSSQGSPSLEAAARSSSLSTSPPPLPSTEVPPSPRTLLVRQAEATLDVLQMKDITELKSLAKPPAGIDLVCEAVMHLQAGIDPNVEVDDEGVIKDGSWKAAQKMMNNAQKFIWNLKAFRACIHRGMVPRANVERARRIQQQMGEHFSRAFMGKKSGAVVGLCVWVINIIKYYDVVTATGLLPSPSDSAAAGSVLTRPSPTSAEEDGSRL